MSNPIIVTGGAGAIGSRLVEVLLAKFPESTITVVDDFSSGYPWLIPDDARVHVVEGDVCNITALLAAHSFRDAYIFHLAAFFANQNSVDHPEADLHTNGLGTLSVLKFAAESQAARLVYASAGCSIAGHGLNEPIREDMPVSLFLDTPYQITKALGEFYCNYYNEQVSTVRCRFFNSFGPGEVPGPYRNVIPNFIWKALHGEPLPITGTGNETRDFIFVDDLIDGLVLSATTDTAAGESLNLGTGRETKVGDMATKIIELCESKSKLEYFPRRSWDKSTRRQADISKAKSLLSFEPKVSFDDGLKQTVEWYKLNASKISESL